MEQSSPSDHDNPPATARLLHHIQPTFDMLFPILNLNQTKPEFGEEEIGMGRDLLEQRSSLIRITLESWLNSIEEDKSNSSASGEFNRLLLSLLS